MTSGTDLEPGRDPHRAPGAELHDQADRQQGRQRRQNRTPEATKPEARTKEQNGQNNGDQANRQQGRRRREPAPRRRITGPPARIEARPGSGSPGARWSHDRRHRPGTGPRSAPGTRPELHDQDTGEVFRDGHDRERINTFPIFQRSKMHRLAAA